MINVLDDVRPDLAPQLAEIILARSQMAPSHPSKNIGGWKSSEALFSWRNAGEEPIAELLAALVDEIEGMRGGTIGRNLPVGWAMVNRMGASHPRHQHYRTITTGIYYVATGDEPMTPTVFELDKTESMQALYGRLELPANCAFVGGTHKDRDLIDLHVFPRIGRLLLFPGSQWHSVPEVQSQSPRITIAFDVRY
jgi:hypothetical protein